MATTQQLRLKPRGVFTGNIYGDECNIRCPVCGYDYTHVREVSTRKGRDKFEAGIYEGTVEKGATDERRSALVVAFDCEGGCKFELIIQQHKGVNIVKVDGQPEQTGEAMPAEAGAFKEPAGPPMILPFGKYKGRAMTDVPLDYLAWMYEEQGMKLKFRRAAGIEIARRRDAEQQPAVQISPPTTPAASGSAQDRITEAEPALLRRHALADCAA